MNSPLKAFKNTEPVTRAPDRKKSNVVSFKSGTSRLIKSFSASPVAVALGDFKHRSDNRDSKAFDYLLIGILSIVVHSAAVDYFEKSKLEKEKVEGGQGAFQSPDYFRSSLSRNPWLNRPHHHHRQKWLRSRSRPSPK